MILLLSHRNSLTLLTLQHYCHHNNIHRHIIIRVIIILLLLLSLSL